MTLRSVTFAAFAFGVSFSTVAAAQDQVWLRDRRYTEGAGYRTGDVELHPGVGTDFGYDSNYGLAASSEHPISMMKLRVTPSFNLATLGQQRKEGEGLGDPPKMTFRLGASATYSQFIATDSANSDAASKYRTLALKGDLGVVIAPQRPVSADLGASIERLGQASTNPEFNYNRFAGNAGGGVTWAPGGGMFDWRLGYQMDFVKFEDDAFSNLDTMAHQANTRGRWRFLPRTAVLFDASVASLKYTNGNALFHDSTPVRARIGVNGLVTSSFALMALVGWGSSFYSGATAQNFDSVIAQAELKWFITADPNVQPTNAGLAVSSAAVGYKRDFGNSYLGDYYSSDRGYANVSHMFAGKVIVSAEGGLARVGYPTIFFPGTGTVRSGSFADMRTDVTGFTEYRIADSFGINATLKYTANISEKKLLVSPTSPFTDDLSWSRFEAYLGARWFM